MEGPFFLLKVELLDQDHPVWRSILIPVNKHFYELHMLIQREFGWYDDHMACFFEEWLQCRLISETCIADGTRPNPILESELYPGRQISYLFAYITGWMHQITVEQIVLDLESLPKRMVWRYGAKVKQYPDEFFELEQYFVEVEVDEPLFSCLKSQAERQAREERASRARRGCTQPSQE